MVQTEQLSEQQETKEAAEQRVAELLLRNEALEEETVTQRHIIHLEQLKTEKESRELDQQKNQLMEDLEQEKLKLEEDIKQLHMNKVSNCTVCTGYVHALTETTCICTCVHTCACIQLMC